MAEKQEVFPKSQSWNQKRNRLVNGRSTAIPGKVFPGDLIMRPVSAETSTGRRYLPPPAPQARGKNLNPVPRRRTFEDSYPAGLLFCMNTK